MRPGGGKAVTYFDADAADAGLPAAHVGQQNVLGLEVAVDDPLAVQDAHGGCNLLQEDPQGVFSQGPLGWWGGRGETTTLPKMHCHVALRCPRWSYICSSMYNVKLFQLFIKSGLIVLVITANNN